LETKLGYILTCLEGQGISRLKQEDQEFKARLATQSDPVSRNQNKTKVGISVNFLLWRI
jgi:hypothetical protein